MRSVFVEREKTGDETLGADQDCSEASIADAVAELEQQLDAAGLRRRWRSLVGSPWPVDLGRALTLRVLSYKLQARRFRNASSFILGRRAQALAPVVPAGGDALPSDGDSVALLERLADLYEKGMLTREEFDSQKRTLLHRR